MNHKGTGEIACWKRAIVDPAEPASNISPVGRPKAHPVDGIWPTGLECDGCEFGTNSLARVALRGFCTIPVYLTIPIVIETIHRRTNV